MIQQLTANALGHIYQMGKRGLCRVCSRPAGSAIHLYDLPTMDGSDDDRESIRQLTEAFELTARMQEPGRNISEKAGSMERESPLFFGTGDNPGLF